MKQPRMNQKKNLRFWRSKLAFGLAGTFLIASVLSACQAEASPSEPSMPEEPSAVSSAPAALDSQPESTPSESSSEPKPSLVISDLPSSQSSQSMPIVPSEPSEPSEPVKPSQPSAPPVSSASPSAASTLSPEVPSTVSTVSEAPPQPSSSKQDVLDDAVFVGNSLIDDLYTYGSAGNADFYFRIGLTVKTVFTKSTAKGSVPVIDELKKRTYGKVLLMFGENELGWSYPSVFVKEYGKVIDAVRERQPNAAIYIQSIFPVSRAVSAKNENQINNTRIEQYNTLLRQLAQDKGVGYLDVASVLKDAQGNLPDNAAPDGVHLNRKYCAKWVDYVKQELAKENTKS